MKRLSGFARVRVIDRLCNAPGGSADLVGFEAGIPDDQALTCGGRSTGFNHSANYRSALCFGQARIIEGGEKVTALQAMIERYFPGCDAGLRPFSTQDIKATTVIGMEIEEAPAKVRAKGNADQPEDLGNPSWAGVIPVTTVIGQAQPCPHNPFNPILAGLEVYAPGKRLDEVLAALLER